MSGAHRDDTGPHKSLEEAILENIDRAAESAQQPAAQALEKVLTIKRIAVALAVFVAAFAVAMVYALIRVDGVADQNQQYLVDACVSGNESRASELEFWLAIFADTADSPDAQTPEGKALRRTYLGRLYKTYPQLDCSKVKDGERVVVPPSPAP